MIIPTFTLPLHIIAAFAVGWIAFLILLWFIMDLRYYAPEGFVFRKCRKDNIPCKIDVDVGSGDATAYAAEVDKKKGPGRIFHKGEAGAKIDPSISSGEDEPIRLPRGLNIQIHGTLDGWPTSVRNAAGIAMIKKIRRKEAYAALDRIPDKELIEILDTPDDNLPHDVKLFIERYKIPNPDISQEQLRVIDKKLDEILKDPDEELIRWMQRDELASLMEADPAEAPNVLHQLILKHFTGNINDLPKEFVPAVLQRIDELKQDEDLAKVKSPIINYHRMLAIINALKEEVSKTAIDPKFGSFRAALKDAPNAFKTVDIMTLENILKQMMFEDFFKKINLLTYGIIFVAIIGVTAVMIIAIIKVTG